MSQTLNALTSSGVVSTTQTFTSGFAPAGKPVAGGGELKVTLDKDGTDDLEVKIVVIQAGTVLATTTVSPTTSPEEYSVSLPAEALAAMQKGSCNVSDISVVISAIGTSPCADCYESGGAPLSWILTFGAATNGSCTDCAPLAGTYGLENVPVEGGTPSCIWRAGTSLCGQEAWFRLNIFPFIDSGVLLGYSVRVALILGEWSVQGGTEVAYWFFFGDCTLSMNLPLISSDGSCNFPGSVSLQG